MEGQNTITHSWAHPTTRDKKINKKETRRDIRAYKHQRGQRETRKRREADTCKGDQPPHGSLACVVKDQTRNYQQLQEEDHIKGDA